MAGELEEEDVSEELESKLATEPVDPRLDLQQLRALKAERSERRNHPRHT